MKKSRRLIVFTLVALTLCICVLFAGCKDAKETMAGIAFKTGEEPRATYVLGQSFDLNSGTLTLIKEDTAGNESISLSAPEVMVSGYDANKLGTQTITVSYGGFTTTFDVNVIPRMAIKGYKVDYMVGETFSTKGSVVIANDDGSTQTVALNDAAITVEGFDSSKEVSPLALTVTYNKDGKSYTGTYNISVKMPEEVKIILPTNKIVYSHQDMPDMNGAQIVVTFGGTQSPVKIDKSMIFGFDPTQATLENMETPVKQTITIRYAGVSKSYEVDLYYSGVSLIRLRASEFGDVKFNEETNEVEPDEVFGPQALEAMREYYKLKNSDKLLIAAEDIEKVVRHAVAYGRVELAKAIEELSNVFIVSDGTFVWSTEGSHADALKAYETISDDNSVFVTLGRLLYEIQGEFRDVAIFEDALVGNNVPEAYSDEMLEWARDLLSFILEIHDQMAEVVPINEANWTMDDLNTPEVEAAITSIVGKIMHGEFSGYGFVPIYQMLSTWRENDDYFDIIYSYYYYGGEEKLEMVAKMFQVVPLPRLLQDIYAGVANGFYAADALTKGSIWLATEEIFRAHKQIQEATAALEASGSDFCKELYEYLSMDRFVENNFTFDNESLGFSNGYHTQVKEMYGDKTFEDMWSSYLAIYELVDENGGVNLSDPETAAAAAEVFKKFVEMSPSWQYSFIASMHNSYREIDRFSRGARLVFDYTDNTAQSNFVYMFATLFMEELTYKDGVDENGKDVIKVYESAEEIVKKLFRAIEMYSLRNRLNTIRAFGSEMEEIELLYSELSGAEKEAFDDAVGYVYDKYIALWKMGQSTTTTEWGDYAAIIGEMQEALKVYFRMDAIINNPTLAGDEKIACYPLLFAAFEKAYACHEILNSIEDKDLLYAYYQDAFELSEELTCSLEHGVWKARDGFINIMLHSSFTVTEEDGTESVRRAWDLYSSSGIQPFMVQAFYIMATQEAGGEFDAEKVLAVMEAYRASETSITSLFYGLGCDKLYYEGLTSFISTFANDTKALAETLLRAEKAYMEYVRAGDEEEADMFDAFKAIVEEAIALQAAVTSVDEYNTNLKDMYEFYLAKYNEEDAPEA